MNMARLVRDSVKTVRRIGEWKYIMGRISGIAGRKGIL